MVAAHNVENNFFMAYFLLKCMPFPIPNVFCICKILFTAGPRLGGLKTQ